MKIWKVLAIIYLGIILVFIFGILIYSDIKQNEDDCDYYIKYNPMADKYLEVNNFTIEIEGMNFSFNTSKPEKYSRVKICKNDSILSAL